MVGATASCRRPRGQGHARRADVVVVSGGTIDEVATTLARTIDERLARTCPARITLRAGDRRDARALAEICVRAGARVTGAHAIERARPFTDGMIEVAIAATAPEDPQIVALRSLARLAFARGLLASAAFVPASRSPTPEFQEIEEAAPVTLDPETRRGIALVVVEHLLTRPGVDARAVLGLARSIDTLGIETALARAPFGTDVETLFASVRAAALSFHPPRAPSLSTVELVGEQSLLAQFDARLAAAPLGVLVCGERYDGALHASGDALTVSFDAARCLELDGARVVTIEVGGLSTSPRGVDGAIVRRTFARAESAPQ
jgi:hypothetical protein